MKLKVLTIALEAIEHLRPIVGRIRRHDRALAKQLTDAANSVVLNIGEGAHIPDSCPRWHASVGPGRRGPAGTRKSRYQTAAGSANEARVGVLAAVRWGHVSEAQSRAVVDRYDHVVAILYKLVHG